MNGFEVKLNQWLSDQIASENNARRRELLQKEIGHGTMEFLRMIWYPAVGNFNHLQASLYPYQTIVCLVGLRRKPCGMHAVPSARFVLMSWRHT